MSALEAEDQIGMLCPELRRALLAGRQAADVLEAEPHDVSHGYDDDEVAAQYAAVDRLVEAFRTLDRQLTKPPAATRTEAVCDECGDEVVFDAWVTASGEIHSQYDENLCLGCGFSVGGRFKEVEVEQ